MPSRDAMRVRGMPYNRMIPKDHAQKTVDDFAEHHRVTPEPAVGPVFGSIMLGDYNNE